jgi:hypothetical protein
MRTFPLDYDSANVTLICIPCAFFEIIAGKIGELEDRDEWASAADWQQGYQAVTRIEECFVTCGQNILDRLDRINASLGYNAGLENDDPSYDAADTLKAQKGQIKAMLEAKLGFSGGGDIETSLEEIRLAVSGQTDEEVRDILAAILAML